MKLRETFRFEAGYQARRVSTWAFVVLLLALVYRTATEGYVDIARDGGFYFNSPFIIATITLLGSMAGLLVAAATAGDAAARDVATRMHPLVYTTPVGKATYLGGRFLAAFALHAVILLAVPAALLLALRLPGLEPELIGPFRPAAYLGAYCFIALPNAFVTTALLFSVAALSRRAMASYLGGVVLFFGSMLTWEFVARELGWWGLAKLLDPLGLTAMSELSGAWTPIEKNARLIPLEGSLLANRLLWMGIAIGVLALTYVRFRFAHPVAGGWWNRMGRRADAGQGTADASMDAAAARGAPITVPRVRRAFGAGTRAWQALAVAGESFRVIVTSWGGAALAFLTLVLALLGPQMLQHMGVPLVPTTQSMVMFLGHPSDILWMIIPLMIVFYAGELVWRERESGLAEIADAAPLPEWVSLAGKFAGLALVLAALQGLMMMAAMLTQLRLGYHDFQPGLYLRVLFGMQLADYLLFALLAMAVHVVIDHKYAGHLVALLAYAFMAFAPTLGIGHNLLVYGSDPGWEYSDMRGFGPFLAPWTWFKAYWAAWALLLAVAARLLWVRGRERGLAARLHLARRRFTRPLAGATVVAAALVLGLGGFVFYNTNVLNEHRTGTEETARKVAYERRFGRYAGVPQPRVTGTRLHVEIHPRRRQVEIRGSYRLVNHAGVPIDTIHLAVARDVETGEVGFDRPAVLVRADEALGHRIYALRTPLQPGDSLRLAFGIRYAARGFRNAGIDASVSADATYFTSGSWLPAIGYQPEREISGAGDRREAGLPPRLALRALDDASARHDLAGVEPIAFEAVVGTDAGQTAAAPGRLLRTWMEGGRRYFHYAADAPIRNEYAFYSSAYAVRTAWWTPPAGAGRPVQIQVFHHPRHAWNVDRMIRGVRAALDYHAARFGPYPQGQIRLVERAGDGNSLHASPVNMWYQEGFARFDPDEDPREMDFVFAVVAHEVAHQWWGNQLTPAYVEGGGLLSESLAWYTAMGVVERTHGPEHLRRLQGMLRELYRMPRARAAPPLLRARESFQYYRQGPFTLWTVREYVGEAAVDTALRRLLRAHGSPTPPLPTSLDLYRELQAVTPDSLRPLLADLFEANTFWELEAKQATAQPVGGGAWRVTLEVEARKVVVDTAGVETERPMDDLVEIGVYAAAGEDGKPGAPLYRRMHRVRSGVQRITVTVPREPARAGIDPRALLLAGEADDNVVAVGRGGSLK
jgi:ABC-type transport system involved in multi-copper enzyme maturation permease subunit